MFNRIYRAWLRARLAIAQQDLDWMETIGRHNIARQRKAVAALRRRLGQNTTAPMRADDITHAVSRRARAELLQ